MLSAPPRPIRFLRRASMALGRVLGRRFPPTWYHPHYRLPVTGLESRAGFDPRRADFVAWHLADSWGQRAADFHLPERVSYRDLARVHSGAWLESLTDPEVLARVFGIDPRDIPVDELLDSMRRVCGGTVEAALWSLRNRVGTLNLMGGLHHAFPDHGEGMCPFNDIAVAVRVLRSEGMDGRIAIIDLDAHPPNGIAACLGGEAGIWIGSLSGSDWGTMPGVDETVLPEHTEDRAYLKALDGLLGRMPNPAFAFVIAGDDVLAGDRLGRLSLGVGGARRRDHRVFKALHGVPSVWVPGGGYHKDSWRILAGTSLLLAGFPDAEIPSDADPLNQRFGKIALGLEAETLQGRLARKASKDTSLLSAEDLEEALGMRRPEKPRLLHFYSATGIEYAFHQYGLLEHLGRLGYGSFRVILDRASCGDRLRALGTSDGVEHMLVELVVEKKVVGAERMLFIHWLNLRNPRVPFSALRPQLPGQDAPGLGIARECCEILLRMAQRLSLDGVAFRPAWYHIAYATRYDFRFLDPMRQGTFEALRRDLGHLPLLTVTQAIARGQVTCNAQTWNWDSGDYVMRTVPVSSDYEARVHDRMKQAWFALTDIVSAEPPPLPAPPSSAW